jgi:benzoyl-CoA reductase subunit D
LMKTAGIDMGAQTVKVVVMDDGRVVSRRKASTGFEPAKIAGEAFEEALKEAGMLRADLGGVLATGSGTKTAPYADGTVSMMGADARAGFHLVPSARTVVDIGAEEARAVKCDDRGTMMNFIVNERCAAGAGTFIEAMARALEVKLEEMGPLSLKADRASPINASCVIFGESDVVTLIHRQEPKPEIARAVFDAMAERTSSMVHRLGMNPDLVLVGGVARDVGFVESLRRKLGVNIVVPADPEYAGALGAALIAASRAKGGSQK